MFECHSWVSEIGTSNAFLGQECRAFLAKHSNGIPGHSTPSTCGGLYRYSLMSPGYTPLQRCMLSLVALIQSAVYNLDTVISVFGHQITDEMRTRIDEEIFAEL